MSVRQSQLNYALAALGGLLMVVVVVTAFWRGVPRDPAIAALRSVPGGDVGRGRAALRRYACGSCHSIPGVPGAEGRVGPRLNDLGNQTYLAGRLPNTAENLVRWIRDPQGVDPQNVMPNLGVTEADARDMAAYLYAVP